MVIKVAVIGCGASGLCALRHLTTRQSEFEAVGFEQKSQPGGTWIYTDDVRLHANGLPVQSSMYKSLRTNLPKEVMAFPDFPFPDDLPSFLKHSDVMSYLQSYCNYFNLSRYIKYETKVEHVEPVLTDSTVKWKVSYRHVLDSVVIEIVNFDAVMVCNGHYEVPLIPDLPGKEEFQGTITHSRDYRVPEPFKDQTVVCLGGSTSGQDIGLDIAKVAKKVIISHNYTTFDSVLPKNVSQKPGVERLGKVSVIYKNGEEEMTDTLVLCTGYQYSFPFLGNTCSPSIDRDTLRPLYKHIIHAEFPTLLFIGITKRMAPFPQFDCQVQYAMSTLNGCVTLPNKEEMKTEIEDDIEAILKDGLPPSYVHKFIITSQWKYMDELARLGHFKPLPRVLQALFEEVCRNRMKDLSGFKTKNYSVINDTFTEI